MIEGFLLDRIDIFGDRLAVNQGKKLAGSVFPNAAASPSTIGDHTVEATEIAANPVIFERLPEFCGMEVHDVIITDEIEGRGMHKPIIYSRTVSQVKNIIILKVFKFFVPRKAFRVPDSKT